MFLYITFIVIGILAFIQNTATYRRRNTGIDVVHRYNVYLLLTFEHTLYSADNYDRMLYSYDYMLFHPWVLSAVRPEYKSILAPYE